MDLTSLDTWNSKWPNLFHVCYISSTIYKSFCYHKNVLSKF